MMILPFLLLISQAGAKDTATLQVDPLLIAEAKEVWTVLGKPNNPLWPGWDATRTPILFYLPDVQDVLMNHPNPPTGFVPYSGPLTFPGGKIYIRNGKTETSMDGQNTSMEINGISTLVVADTLSNRRNNLKGLVDYVRSGGADTKELLDSNLKPQPYDSMQMIAHEAFHVYQGSRAPNKGSSELALVSYPSLSVQNNIGVAMEAEALSRALHASAPSDIRSAAVEWLAIRDNRRKGLPAICSAYEDGTEYLEGLAKYVEYKLLQVLEKRKPSKEMYYIQGFHGYSDLSKEREALIQQMLKMTSGEANVNNDLYGASPVRMRLYYSGLGAGALLDKIGEHWHDEIFKDKATLTDLIRSAVDPTDAELAAAWSRVVASPRYAELKTAKEKLASDGQAHIQSVLKSFESAPGRIVLDYSQAPKTQPGFAFTPFGILRMSDTQTVFRLIPIRGIAGAAKFRESQPNPVLLDRSAKAVTLMLSQTPTLAVLGVAVKDGVVVGKIDFGGVTVEANGATVEVKDGTLTIHVKDA